MEPKDTEWELENTGGNTRKGLKYSTKKTNPLGLSEGELKQLVRHDSIPPWGYKKRRLNELTVEQRIDILHSYLVEN